MEKLEVGQVWTHRIGAHKITHISGKTVRFSTLRSSNRVMCFSVFRKWITRTGAKLEGTDGK